MYIKTSCVYTTNKIWLTENYEYQTSFLVNYFSMEYCRNWWHEYQTLAIIWIPDWHTVVGSVSPFEGFPDDLFESFRVMNESSLKKIEAARTATGMPDQVKARAGAFLYFNVKIILLFLWNLSQSTFLNKCPVQSVVQHLNSQKACYANPIFKPQNWLFR